MSSYDGVVSRKSIITLLTYATLMKLDVMADDIRNIYLQAPSSEKYYFIYGTKFGIENMGKVAFITRSLYVGKVDGNDFWHHL